jgi:hypothetical protein
MNSNLLKEAIADAKAVRATALANAKASLEEAFNSRFSAVFADKLREDSATESQPSVDAPVAETVEPKDAKPSKNDGTKSWSKDNAGPKPTDKNITPNTIPSAKDGGDGTKGWSKDNKGNAFDGTPKGVKENATEGAVEEESVEETVTNEDLDEIIRELEAEAGAAPMDDMPPVPGGDAGGPPVPGDDEVPGEETPGEESQEIKSGDTVVISKVEAPVGGTPPPPGGEVPPMGGPDAGAPPTEEPAPMEEEEIDLNELLASLNEEAKEEKEEEKEEDDKEEKCDETVALQTQLNEVTSERNEAYKTVEYLQKQLNEINLLNAKLLYTNKLFKEFGMNRDQKTKVVEAFDLTKCVREVKMTYANWCESLNLGGNLKRKALSQNPINQVTTITEGAASKPVASTKPSKEVITEGVNQMAQRFQKLAGIPAKK